MATLLQKFVDADQWEAEDIVGRLGMVMHGAFLFIGFQPYGAQPPSGHLLKRAGEAGSLCLSRWYTVPQLAHHKSADAAVLMLCAQGSNIALLMFLTTDCHLRSVYRERLDKATITPLLSRTLGDTEPWVSRIGWTLADGVCWGLLVELCRRNGLPLTSFMSMPDDIKTEILKRFTDDEDLARVECTCRQLRRLVAERDGELWKPMYEALGFRRRTRRLRLSFFLDFESSDSQSMEVLSWREKYVEARQRPWARIWRRLFFDSFPVIAPIGWTDFEFSCTLDGLQDPPEQETVSTRGEGRRVHRQKVARNDCKKKRHAAGAIHSPSSRYRWKHR
ncbi:uncharacterized protein LOC133903869 [Phragmites australis]|uniref:uncharacterized protein LOC133903869 n=1 Tax=Phragmites australis TaxID=29695 RepID=UPI002D78BC2B|nr:uncharacterized protein LOC133903869 [Phragmites australis]